MTLTENLSRWTSGLDLDDVPDRVVRLASSQVLSQLAAARAAVARRGEPYTFGLGREQAGRLLSSLGFDVEDNLTITELARRFGPFPYSADDFFGVITGRRAAR